MSQQKIISIDSNEINEIIKKIGDSVIDLQNNAYQHVDNDYNTLEELELVGEGLTTTKRGIDKVIEEEAKIIKLLKNHLDVYKETEEEIVAYINSFDYSKTNTKRASSASKYDESDLDDVMTERRISNRNIKDFITGMDPSLEKILLKNINKNTSLFSADINDLLINPEKSGLLVEVLKKICGDTNTDINTKSTVGSMNIQKALLEKLTDNETNIFSSIIGSSLLVALPYVSKKSEEENISFEDMLYKDENKEKLLGALDDLYQGKPLDGYELQDAEVNSFREYINTVAENNNMQVEDLLSSTANLDLIKKGA